MTATVRLFLPNDKIAYVTAGPTAHKPKGMKLVRCAAEIKTPSEEVLFDISTTDFKPFDPKKLSANLPALMRHLMNPDSEHLYIGCMGGTGRTGTILAILAAQHPMMTGDAAIEYIRAVYRRHAVETKDQMKQVMDFEEFWYNHTHPEVEALSDAGWYLDPAPEKPTWGSRLRGALKFIGFNRG